MCNIVNEVYNCGHEGEEVRREYCLFFHGARILITRNDDRYDQEIEINKKDCISTSKYNQEPATGLCPDCAAVLAPVKSKASKKKIVRFTRDTFASHFSSDFTTPQKRAAPAEDHDATTSGSEIALSSESSASEPGFHKKKQGA